MRSRAPLLLVLSAAGSLLAFAACVGDDSTSSPAPSEAGTPDTGPSGDDSGGPPADSGGDASGQDAATTKPCDPTAAFESSGPVSELDQAVASAEDRDARLSPDEKTVYWVTDRTGATPVVYTATRASSSDAFSGFAQVMLQIGAMDTPFGPSLGGKPDVLFYGIFHPASGGGEPFHRIEWEQKNGANWSASTSVASASAGLPIGGYVSNPYVSVDGLTIVFEQHGTGDASADYVIEEAQRNSLTDDFGTKAEHPELGQSQSHPILSADKLTIYFATDRATGGDPTYNQIWVATRAKTSDPFGTAAALVGGQVNDTTDDYPTWISADQCTLYFTTTRGNAAHAVYKARRTPPM